MGYGAIMSLLLPMGGVGVGGVWSPSRARAVHVRMSFACIIGVYSVMSTMGSAESTLATSKGGLLFSLGVCVGCPSCGISACPLSFLRHM